MLLAVLWARQVVCRGAAAAGGDAQHGGPGAHGGRRRLGGSLDVCLRVERPPSAVTMAGGGAVCGNGSARRWLLGSAPALVDCLARFSAEL